jgi:hypothetical protein
MFEQLRHDTQKILEILQHDRDTRLQNHSLLVDDLKELGILGELSEDNNYTSMPFEDYISFRWSLMYSRRLDPFETLLLSMAVDWLAQLFINSNLEVRIGKLSISSELRAAYSSQKTLPELNFHHHDDTNVLETRIRGAMSNLENDLQKSCCRPHSQRNSEATKYRQ